MCTAIIEVPESSVGAVRLLAVRDEDPSRAWDPPGRWWPSMPDLIGVRDRVAGGAWLAASTSTGRIAMILNRAEPTAGGIPAPPAPASRGALSLAEVTGEPIPDKPRTANFNLVSIRGGSAGIISWNGAVLQRTELDPGMHMIAHHDVDDAEHTPRIERWLPEFRAIAGLPQAAWRQEWLRLLAETSKLDAEDDRAIVRDNRVHGYPTLSLLYCLTESVPADVSEKRGLRIDTAVLADPGHWAAGQAPYTEVFEPRV